MSEDQDPTTFEYYGEQYDEMGVVVPPPAGDPDTMSGLIATMPEEQRPKNAPCCSICPMAAWQRRMFTDPATGEMRARLRAYCKVFHEWAYDDSNPQPAVLNCDGLDLALKKKHDTPALTVEDVIELIRAEQLRVLEKPADDEPLPELNR